jgi:hypothetical protein
VEQGRRVIFKKNGTSTPLLTTMRSQTSWVKSEETSQVPEVSLGERTVVFTSSVEECKSSFVGHSKQCIETTRKKSNIQEERYIDTTPHNYEVADQLGEIGRNFTGTRSVVGRENRCFYVLS